MPPTDNFCFIAKPRFISRARSPVYRCLFAVKSRGTAAIFCEPQAQFLGITPQDIIVCGLADATHPLTKTDIELTTGAIDNDPFFSIHPQWLAAIEQLLEMGVRTEQQAMVKRWLNYVIDEYLPRKLEDRAGFCPDSEAGARVAGLKPRDSPSLTLTTACRSPANRGAVHNQ